MNWVTTIYNHPQPCTITKKTVHNHPQPPTTNYNHLQPPTTMQNLPKKAKSCHIQLLHCTLDVNAETDIDFDSDMKQ